MYSRAPLPVGRVNPPATVTFAVPTSNTAPPCIVRPPESVTVPVGVTVAAQSTSMPATPPDTVCTPPQKFTEPDADMVAPVASRLPPMLSELPFRFRTAPEASVRSVTDTWVDSTGPFSIPAGMNTLLVPPGTTAGLQFDAVAHAELVVPSHVASAPTGIDSALNITCAVEQLGRHAFTVSDPA